MVDKWQIYLQYIYDICRGIFLHHLFLQKSKFAVFTQNC